MNNSLKIFLGGALLALIGLILYAWYQSYMKTLYLNHENNLLRDKANFLVGQNGLLLAQSNQLISDNQLLQNQSVTNNITKNRNMIGFKK